MRARCGEGCATRPPLGRQSNGSELARLLDFWLVATTATMATPGADLWKKDSARKGWVVIPSYPSFKTELGVATVAMFPWWPCTENTPRTTLGN